MDDFSAGAAVVSFAIVFNFLFAVAVIAVYFL